MGKLLKIILWLVLVLVVVIVVAAVVLPMVVDPNDYKDEIATAVEQQTGRTLTIEGDIGLSVFPWLGLDIGPTRLSNAEGFTEPDMAEIQAVQVRVKLLPLLSNQLEVDTLQLSGLRLHLGKDKQGVSNWDDMVTASADTKAAEPATTSVDSTGGGKGLDALTIGGIEVTDARIDWDDQSSGSKYVVNDLSLTTGAIVPGDAFDLDMQLQLTAMQPPLDARLALQGEVLLAADLKALSITALTLQVDASGATLPAGELQASLTTDVSLGLEAQTLLLPNIVLETLGVQISGSVTGAAISGDDPRFNGNFVIAEFSPRELIEALGEAVPETADQGVLDKADATLAWEATLQQFKVSTLSAHLDETALNGDVLVQSFDAPAISFNLAVDQFNLDRYLPPESEQPVSSEANKEARGKAGKTAAPAGDLPLEPLRQLDLKGEFNIKELQAFKLHYSEVLIKIDADDGVLEISPLAAGFYDGDIDLHLKLDARKDTPQVSIKETLKGVQAGPLLKDLTGEDTLLGTTTLQANLKGRGADADAIIRTLNGKASFTFKDGALNGVNIAALIREAQALIEGKPAPKQEGPVRTDFALLKGSATIKNGVVKNDDLKMKSPLLRINGAGTANLPKETLDYTLTTRIVGSLEGQGGKSKLQGVDIPVHVSGTFSDPDYSPDLGGVLSEAAKAEVDKRVEKEKKKLQKKFGKDVPDDLLKGLFDK